jgi:signal transduction histidine kinase
MGTRKILLVDDDPVLAEIGAENLIAAGFDVVSASNGEDALRLIRTESVDLVVLDIEMPKLNGLSLLKWIRSSQREAIAALPVIMLTGRNDDKAVQTCYDFGATSFVSKPVNWVNMVNQVAFVLRSSDDSKALRVAHDLEKRLSQAKDGLMMTLRHELRSPLHVIQGFSTLLSKTANNKLSVDEKHSLATIDETVSEMALKLSRLFLYAETLAGDFALASDFTTASRIADRAIKSVNSAAENARVTINLNLPDGVPIECKLDEEKLIVALSEILGNAIKFTSGGSLIDLTVSQNEDSTFSIIVDDDGDGIDETKATTLFEPFVQGDGGLTRTSVGVGLGLSVAKSIIERHGGTVNISNNDRGGASVAMSMPTLLQAAQQDAA